MIVSGLKALTVRDLPPFQPIATRILQLVGNNEAFVSLDLVNAIESEPAFCAELLQIANSPGFGFASRINTISHAVALLGIERIKTLAFRLAMRGYVGGAAKSPVIGRCWLHSLACAEVARRLALAVGISKELAYTAGLIHDVGRLALLNAYSKAYTGVLETAHETSAEGRKAEEQLFGSDHCKVGGLLVRGSNLPANLIEVVQCHHDAIAESRPGSLLQVVQVGCLIATKLRFESGLSKEELAWDSIIAELPPDMQERMNLKPETLESVIVDRIDALEPELAGEHRRMREERAYN